MVLDQKGFDRWAGEYDKLIDLNDTEYPFAGYYQVLQAVRSLIPVEGRPAVLDLGVGTGLLTAELYKRGCQVVGLDFSREMLIRAAQKMPGAELYYCDLAAGISHLPGQVGGRRFDYIVSTYALHHLPVAEQIKLIAGLAAEYLLPHGRVVVGDVAFATADNLKNCRKRAGEYWDGEEYYIVMETIAPALERKGLGWDYQQISHCGGVLEVWKR